MAQLAENLKIVQNKIAAACSKRSSEYKYFEPCLVAVSKLQPPESIIEAYEAGQRHFGENYVNELAEKGNHKQILEKCVDIHWHFIGHLQRNKVNKILNVPNLYIIETIDNEKLASTLNTSWPKFRKHDDLKLKVMVQVNTSNEQGLMTIGMFGYDVTKGPNPDFLCLKECKEKISKELAIDLKEIELSMGMSNDYEHAVELGSTSVRVGTAIFGARPKKNV